MEEDCTMATILVIEDEPQLLLLWGQVLEAAGYRVHQARDIAEGLTLCQQHGIDLVMAELPIAEEEAIAMIGALRALSPPVKMLVLSGGGPLGASARLTHALRTGAHVAFQKPISAAELLEAVQELLRGF
jgi:DNA-binding NtrC family response regulator